MQEFASPLGVCDQVHSRDGDAFTWCTSVDEDAYYFRGHYPDFHIMPGVFILESAVQAARRHLEARCVRPLEITLVPVMRFLAPVLPGMTLEVQGRIHPSADGESMVVQAVCTHSEGVRAAELTFHLGCVDGSGEAR